MTVQEKLSKCYRRKRGQARGRDELTAPSEIPVLLWQTQSPDPKERCAAVGELCPCHVQANHPEVWMRILELAQDADLTVRKRVFHILCDGSPRERAAEVVQALEKMQQDPDTKLRRQVRKMLAQYRRTGNVNIL